VPPKLESAAVFTTAVAAGADDGWPAAAELVVDELEALPQALNSTDAATTTVGMTNLIDERTMRLLSGDC
jgi:hypothetical protein